MSCGFDPSSSFLGFFFVCSLARYFSTQTNNLYLLPDPTSYGLNLHISNSNNEQEEKFDSTREDSMFGTMYIECLECGSYFVQECSLTHQLLRSSNLI